MLMKTIELECIGLFEFSEWVFLQLHFIFITQIVCRFLWLYRCNEIIALRSIISISIVLSIVSLKILGEEKNIMGGAKAACCRKPAPLEV